MVHMHAKSDAATTLHSGSHPDVTLLFTVLFTMSYIDIHVCCNYYA